MLSARPTIGIIGGMGPRATVNFEQKLLDRFAGSDQDLPDIICANIGRIPDRTEFLTGNGEDPVVQISDIIRRLESAGADILCMPCNTAHAPAIFGRLRQSTKLLILNMPHLTIKLLKNLELNRCLVLATEGSAVTGIFDDPNTFFPNDNEQRLVNNAIDLIKRGQKLPIGLKLDIRQIAKTTNADGVVLGCTELSVLGKVFDGLNLQVIETLDVLADSCVEYLSKRSVNDRHKEKRLSITR